MTGGDVIRWSVLLIVVGAAGGSIYFKYQDARPCVHPIPYAIGPVDARFDITNSALIADAEMAASIWNTAAGKQVLIYDPKAAMKISLIYDEREANAKLGSSIAQQQANADSERATLDAAQANYLAQQAAYNETVAAINARGGASKSESVALAEQRASLQSLANSLKAQVARYNESVTALNAQVAVFNKSAGHTFEEGKFTQDASGRRIDIFEFIGTTQLERVLAHEFGHALGLDHNSDPKSIMYAQNESGNLVPTTLDLSALRAICGT